jgi:hypothetical protein
MTHGLRTQDTAQPAVLRLSGVGRVKTSKCTLRISVVAEPSLPTCPPQTLAGEGITLRQAPASSKTARE